MRSSKGLALLLVLGGGLLALLAVGRRWAAATVPGLTGVPVEVSVTGRDAAPAAAALALVALAGAVALLLSGRLARRVVAVALVGCGAGLVAVGAGSGGGRGQALTDAAARATGAAVRTPAEVSGSSWPLVCAAAGGLVLAGGFVALIRSGRWAGPARSYEVPAGGAGSASAAGSAAAPAGPGSGARDRALDAWEALSAGHDPTERPTDDDPARSAGPPGA